MNRRSFLGAVATILGAAALPNLEFDPKKALWIPGAKTFFDFGATDIAFDFGGADVTAITTYSGVNTLLTIDIITREALKVLNNNLKFSQTVNRCYEIDHAMDAMAYVVGSNWPRRPIPGIDLIDSNHLEIDIQDDGGDDDFWRDDEGEGEDN